MKKKLKWRKYSKTHYACHVIFKEPAQFEAVLHKFDIVFKDWGERKFWCLIYDGKNLYFEKLSVAKQVAQLIHNG